MTDAFRDLKERRLPNWGRYARRNPGAPDCSCSNPLYDQYMPDSEVEAWGEVAVEAQKTDAPAIAEHDEIDVWDAEVMDCWIGQLTGDLTKHKIALVRKFNMGHKRILVDDAIRALLQLMGLNRLAVDEIEGRLRGK